MNLQIDFRELDDVQEIALCQFVLSVKGSTKQAEVAECLGRTTVKSFLAEAEISLIGHICYFCAASISGHGATSYLDASAPLTVFIVNICKYVLYIMIAEEFVLHMVVTAGTKNFAD